MARCFWGMITLHGWHVGQGKASLITVSAARISALGIFPFFFWLAKINTTLFLPASPVLIGINSARTRQREGRCFQMTFKDEKGDSNRGVGSR